ncbi:MAG TPA: hypothetical protein PKX06_08895 [Phenylobacterium sp.]|nr:hypothetical protein [Phenylobacterium sp.]
MNDLSPAQADFLRLLRQRNITTRERVEMMRDGRLSLRSLTASGWDDISHEAITRDEAEIAENERIFAAHDPHGLTIDPADR